MQDNVVLVVGLGTHFAYRKLKMHDNIICCVLDIEMNLIYIRRK